MRIGFYPIAMTIGMDANPILDPCHRHSATMPMPLSFHANAILPQGNAHSRKVLTPFYLKTNPILPAQVNTCSMMPAPIKITRK
jgi:hypothetical protein